MAYMTVKCIGSNRYVPLLTESSGGRMCGRDIVKRLESQRTVAELSTQRGKKWYNSTMKSFAFLLTMIVPVVAAAGVAVGPLPAPDYADTEVSSNFAFSVEMVEHGFRVHLL